MKRALKIAGLTLAGLVALLAASVAALVWLVDPNAYRDDIERLVEQRTGRALAIDGPLELSLFPWLGAEIGRTTLGNAGGFGPEPFARVAGADLRVRVLPLLWGEVAIGKVVIHGAEIHLRRDAEGRSNWADLAGTAGSGAASEPPAAGGPPAEPTTPQPAPPEQAPGGPLAALSVGGLELREARVTWADAITGTRLAVSELDLTSGAVRPGRPFPLEASFRIAGQAPDVAGTFRLSGEASVDPPRGRYRLTATRLEADLTGGILPTGRMVARLNADLAADLTAATARIDRLDARAYGTRVQGRAELEGITSAPRVDGRLHATAEDGERLTALLKALGPELAWQPEAIAGSYLKAGVQGGLTEGDLALRGIEAGLFGLHLAGTADVQRPGDGLVVSADLSGRVADGRRLLSPVAGSLPPDLRAAGLNDSRLGARGRLDLGTDTLALPQLRLATLGTELRANASVRQLTTAPAASGRVAVAPFSPRKALRRLGLSVPETADPEALGEAALTATVAADPSGAALPNVDLSLDRARLTGSASVPDVSGPRVRFDLALNGIDLDRYLPPPAEDGDAPPAPATPGEAAGAGASQLPMAPLRSLDVAGELDVGRLRVRGLRLDDLHLALDGRDGRFRLHPLTARLYEGRYRGDVRLDVGGDTPRVTLDERLAGVALGPLLNDAVGKAHLTGDADIEAALTFTGSEPRAMLRSLTGQGRYRLRDGTVAGVDVGRALRAAYRAVGKGKQGGDRAAGTRFRELNGSATIREGRVHSDDLALDAEVMALAGKGYLDLADARVDYRLDGRIPDDAAIKELRGLTVPVRITGPVSDPAVRVDLAAALEQRAAEALEQEKEKAKQRLDKRLEEKKEDLKKQLEDKAKELLRF